METIIKNNPWFKEILKKPELQDITLQNLYEFYLTDNNISKILPIITSNSHISIRVLDWFVTNYSKKYNIMYELSNCYDNDNKFFNVFLQYKCQLKGYKKKLFDPFCRKQRIAFYYNENKCVITTIGQLNFFMWAVKYDVLSYVEKNLKQITNDMIRANKSLENKCDSVTSSTSQTEQVGTNTSDTEKIRRKRHELSINANKTINIHNYSIVLSFDYD